MSGEQAGGAVEGRGSRRRSLRERLRGTSVKGEGSGEAWDAERTGENTLKWLNMSAILLDELLSVKLCGAKRLEGSIAGTDGGPVLLFSQAGGGGG